MGKLVAVVACCALSVGGAISLTRPEPHRAESRPVVTASPVTAPVVQPAAELPPLALPVTRPIGGQLGGTFKMGPHTLPLNVRLTVTSCPANPGIVGLTVPCDMPVGYVWHGQVGGPNPGPTFFDVCADVANYNVRNGPSWSPVGTPLAIRVTINGAVWGDGLITQTSAAPFSASGSICHIHTGGKFHLPLGSATIGVVLSE